MTRLSCLASIAVLVGVTSGCTSLQSVSVSSVPKDRARPVSASENNVAFLGIHFDNEFVDDLPERLKAQCPGGKVVGMFTKYENTWYVLVADREVTVHGYCVYDDPKGGDAARQAKTSPRGVPAPPLVTDPAAGAPPPPPVPPPPPPAGELPAAGGETHEETSP